MHSPVIHPSSGAHSALALLIFVIEDKFMLFELLFPLRETLKNNTAAQATIPRILIIFFILFEFKLLLIFFFPDVSFHRQETKNS
jgi:phosphate starvation-inducible membrane PsiE